MIMMMRLLIILFPWTILLFAMSKPPLALIVGVGDGLSASVARLLFKKGYSLALAARDTTKLQQLATETNATCYSCDATKKNDVEALFAQLSLPPKVVIYNPSRAVRGPIAEVDPEQVKNALDVTAYGAFLVGQQAAKYMLKEGHQSGGTILFTGASAGVKGFPKSAAFAMGKFAQRGLAQSMSRELHPQNIHVVWINIDGGIIRNPKPHHTVVTVASTTTTTPPEDSMLDPDEIAKTYLHLIEQHRSVWTDEIAIRPWVERF